jgi:hypothetical protein
MLEKTMKTVIRKKVNDWLESIEDKKLVTDIENNIILTGGAIVSLVNNEPPNDYDLYFRDRDTVKKVAQYYCDKWNKAHKGQSNKIGIPFKAFVLDGKEFSRVGENKIKIDSSRKDLIEFFNGENILTEGDHEDNKFSGQTRNVISIAEKDRIKIWIPSDGIVSEREDPIDENYYEKEDLLPPPEKVLEELDGLGEEELEEAEKYKPVMLTSNAISLTNKVQLIIRFWGEPDEIHKNYDFTHCKTYWDSKEGKVNISAEVYETIINKTLKYTGSLYPICSLFRLRKFIKRGWNINAGQVLKIAWQISELNLSDIDVLEEQLVGVDSLYFLSLINALKAKQEKDPNFDITQEYVTSIIDKIF